VDLREAAELLDTSTEAVRKRATRGSLRSERHDGRVVVWVDEGRTEGGRGAQVDREALLEAKDETISILRNQLRLRAEELQRRDVIISQLTQAHTSLAARLPQLEAAERREEAAEESVEATPTPPRAHWVKKVLGWTAEIVRHPQKPVPDEVMRTWVRGLTKEAVNFDREKLQEPKDPRAFLPKRWIVERTFSWLGQNRRLSLGTTSGCRRAERPSSTWP
jgi:transposase